MTLFLIGPFESHSEETMGQTHFITKPETTSGRAEGRIDGKNLSWPKAWRYQSQGVQDNGRGFLERSNSTGVLEMSLGMTKTLSSGAEEELNKR